MRRKMVKESNSLFSALIRETVAEKHSPRNRQHFSLDTIGTEGLYINKTCITYIKFPSKLPNEISEIDEQAL